jgi:prepilin peptidase CpaA
MNSSFVSVAIAASACGAAVYTDLATRRVPNALTLPLMIAAPAVAAFDGVHAALVAAAIVLGALLGGTIVHAMGVLGGGDVKLLAGVAGFAGFPACIEVALYTAVCGGMLALVVSTMRGELGGTLARVRLGVAGTIAGRSLAVGSAAMGATGTRIPYALAIGAGFALATLAQTSLPFLRIIR